MRKVQLASVAFLAFLTLASFTKLPKQNKLNGVKAALASPGNAHVNGGGTAMEAGEKSTFVFNAVELPDGSVNGHLNYKFRATDISIDVDITCMTINGNRATLFGTVTSVSGDNPPFFVTVGNTASFTVEDNGNGKSGDKISDLFFSVAGNPVSCTRNYLTYLNVSGNISVKE